jgi:hypothetical protein
MNGEVVTYSYRPSLMGSPLAFRLTDRGIDWESGSRSGTIPYRDVRRMRMSFRPVSMQQRRYMTELWAEGDAKLVFLSSSWKSLFEQESLAKSYTAFISELHRRLVQAAPSAVFEQGTHPLRYWPGVVILTGVALGLAALIVSALKSDAKAGALFIAGFLALFLWYGGNYFRRNRPGVYRPDMPPAELLPG